MPLNYLDIKNKIELAWENRDSLKSPEVKDLIVSVIELLNRGEVRAAHREYDKWVVNEWVKKAILLFFMIRDLKSINSGDIIFYDKVDVKKDYHKTTRVVPNAVAREGVFVGEGVVLMPSYINIGAYIDNGSMIDIGAAIGSCAQVGKNVHISAGSVIGGVLEPIQDSPVIIEDNVFIGANSTLVEGVLIESHAVIGANVSITGSSKIIDVTHSQPIEYIGRVPSNSIVIPGTLTKKFPSGEYNVNCALIIGQRKESTNKKTSINEILRGI